jgi:hypothetical protein
MTALLRAIFNYRVSNYQINPILLHIIITTIIITPKNRVLPGKLTGPQLVKKFSAFYGTRRLITAFTRARHTFLSSATAIQSMFLIPLVEDLFPSAPRSSKWTPFLTFSHQTPTCTSPLPTLTIGPAHLILLGLIIRIIFGEL